jgi:hypothetical protein
LDGELLGNAHIFVGNYVFTAYIEGDGAVIIYQIFLHDLQNAIFSNISINRFFDSPIQGYPDLIMHFFRQDQFFGVIEGKGIFETLVVEVIVDILGRFDH